MKTWHIKYMSPFTGDAKDIIYTYHNKGHAIAKLKKLVNDAWKHGSEMQYCIRRG